MIRAYELILEEHLMRTWRTSGDQLSYAHVKGEALVADQPRQVGRSLHLPTHILSVEGSDGLEDVRRSSLDGAGSDDVQDHGVPLGLAQRCEDLPRLRIRRQCGDKIGRNGGFLLRLVGGVPPTVGLGGVDLREA